MKYAAAWKNVFAPEEFSNFAMGKVEVLKKRAEVGEETI